MANPILKEDLIGNGVQEALDKMSTTLSTITANLIGLRTAVGESIQPLSQQVSTVQNDSAAVAALEAKLSKYEDTITKLNAALKENNNMQRQVNEAKSKTIELSEYEANKLKTLQDRLKLGAIWQQSVAEGIDTTNMSYNAMKATMNSLLATLRSFDTESKKNSTAAMALESAVERLRDAMKELDGNTKAIANAEKQMAEESKKAAKEAAEAAKQEAEEAKKAAKEKADAAKKAAKEKADADKEAAAAAKAAAKERAQFGKLNDNEYESVRRLNEQYQGWVRTLEAGHSIHLVNYNDIEVEKMSYNQLYSTYNVLKDALNKLTTEQRENSEVGKYMTEQALKVRDTMNELQKSTGNYTLQVGKYRAAFDGLGYSFQQILREAPSALNIQQFFLAISNNIPLFMDQLDGYNKKQKEIAESLKILEDEGKKGTEEYAKLANNVEGWGKHLLRSLLSWQTAIIAITFIIRMYGAKIIEWIKNIGKGAEKAVEYFKTMRQAIAQINAEVEQRTASLRSEFTLINDEMERVKRGTEEWSGIVKRVNELTHSTLDDVKATPEEIKKVTAAYLEQQRQIEINKRIVAADVQNEMNRQGKAGAFNSNLTPKERESYMTWKTDDAGKEYMKLLDKYDKANYAYQRAYNTFAQMDAQMKKNLDEFTKDIDRQYGAKLDKSNGSNASIRAITEWRDQQLADYINSLTNTLTWDVFGIREAFGAGAPTNVTANLRNAAKTESWEKKLDVVALEQEITKFINENAENYSTAYMNQLKSMYKAGRQKYKKEGGGHTPSLKDVDFLESELLDKDAVIELESSYERRLAMLAKEEEKERQILLEKYKRESIDLEFNHEKHLITEAEYQEQRAKLDTNYKNLTKTNYEGNFEEMGVIQRKYWNKRNEITAKEAEKEEKEALKRDKQAIKDIENRYASEYKVVKRRVKTISDEVQKNTDLAFNIGKAKEELAELNQLVIESSEDTSGYTARINELTKAIEKWRSQMDFTKQLSNYKNPWDILQRNGAFNASGDMKKGILGSILGVDTLNGMSEDQIDSAFETWLDNLGSSISTWYNTTMGYINDLIGAYVDLANAKAEAAKEATEAAQEEYEKEKALLEAGYASRVEATWAEYQEKKAAQEQAEKDAKAAAEAQQQLNEISTLGSLVTASANIWKTFTEIPVVGVPLAIAAIGTMFGSFLAAKMKAAQVSQYGEGGFEVLEGSSHASGHDIDLGVNNRRGRRMHVEGKEGLGIFRVKAMQHYGADAIENVVNGINHLEYEQSVGRTLSLQRDMGLHNTMILPRTNLHKVESSLDKLVSYGSSNRYYDPDGTEVITTASGTTRIRRR